jgi:hypothetical protein
VYCLLLFGDCFRVKVRRVWDDGVWEGEGGMVYYIGSDFVCSFKIRKWDYICQLQHHLSVFHVLLFCISSSFPVYLAFCFSLLCPIFSWFLQHYRSYVQRQVYVERILNCFHLFLFLLYVLYIWFGMYGLFVQHILGGNLLTHYVHITKVIFGCHFFL